jgi:Tn3 transposase DDE domain/Pyridine nucleotide-disulphide oxidoreductase
MLDLLMSAELVGRARTASDQDKARRHPRLARASARLSVAVEALFDSDGWGGEDEEPRVSQVWEAIEAVVSRAELGVPALERSRLSHVCQNYIRPETLAAANAPLVARQAGLPLALAWGGGLVAAVDGMRFVVPVPAAFARPNRKFFGSKRGMTWLNAINDRGTGRGAKIVSGTVRDSLHMIDVIFGLDSGELPEIVVSDAASYSDVVFGLLELLGISYRPALADLPDQKGWRIKGDADYGPLNTFARGKIDLAGLAVVAQRHGWDMRKGVYGERTAPGDRGRRGFRGPERRRGTGRCKRRCDSGGPDQSPSVPALAVSGGGRIVPPGLIAPALRRVVRNQRNVRVLLAEVRDVDLELKVVHASEPAGHPHDLPYDTLVVAAGATHSYFGQDQFAKYAPGMKTIEDARYLRDAILSRFEMAELTSDPRDRAAWLRFVVIGAGPTGVELTGQIAELAHRVLPRDFRSVDTTEARIILLEGASAVLPSFVPKLQRYARRQLEKKGVEVRLDTLAADIDHDSVVVDGPGDTRGSGPGRGSGRQGYRPRRWRGCSPARSVRSPTRPGGCRSARTARCPATRRCSPSETWCH